MVGNLNRIPCADLAAYKEQQRARSRAAMDTLYEIDLAVDPAVAPTGFDLDMTARLAFDDLE